MTWEGVTVMDQKVRFVAECLQQHFCFAEICNQFNISRKTGYKWLKRYNLDPEHGLCDLSRRPHICPHQTSKDLVEEILRIRRQHSTWGPKKILALLIRRTKKRGLPAVSTIADIIKRNGLVEKRKRRVKRSHPGCPMTIAKQPNQIWAADYKGQFKMLNGRYCFPLTVSDLHSRFILECNAQRAVSFKETKKCFTKLFREYGLPERIRTDNGVPFASSAIARLSKLSVWWIKLGIYPELIEPGEPQQNGKHERMHRTLKAETTYPPQMNLSKQQKQFDTFVKEFNFIRPHESLGQKTPSTFYKTSNRKFPENLPDYEYPGYFEVRKVSKNGGLRWNGERVSISHTLIHENIGFEMIDEGIYNVYLCNIIIGRFDERTMKITDVISRVPLRNRVGKNCHPCT